MILLDTHVWVWWVQGDPRLARAAAERIEQAEHDGIAVSAISCWEIAKLVEHSRLVLPLNVEEWLNTALSYPGVQLAPITPRIAVESTQLPGEFHADPADQLIVATARVQLKVEPHGMLSSKAAKLRSRRSLQRASDCGLGSRFACFQGPD